jgi:hypothetical protein
MTHKIKALGIAMFAVLAISAVAASAVSANENAKFTSPIYPTTVFTTDSVMGNEFLTLFGAPTGCKHVEFHGTLAAGSSTLTSNPKYKDCLFSSVLPATINLTSCDFLFHVGTTKAADEYNGSMSIACTTPGDTVDITVYSSVASHTAGTAICHIMIGAQGPLLGLSFKVDTGATNDFTISGTATGIVAKQERISATCPPGTEEKNGKYTFKNPVTYKGSNPEGGASRSIDIG